jgi:hypothetical protein
MRATRRERYSPFSGCKVTLHCWDGIGFGAKGELTRCSHTSTRHESFLLDLNGSSVGTGSAGKDHKVATRGLVLAAH